MRKIIYVFKAAAHNNKLNLKGDRDNFNSVINMTLFKELFGSISKSMV